MRKWIFAAALTLAFAAQAARPARVMEVEHPQMRVYLPADSLATGRAVVALPGGGYAGLAKNHEGYDWAPFFNSRGIALAVVSYRLPAGDRCRPMADAEAAVRLMRDSAEVWGLRRDEVGIMGSSAGGHLASTVATRAGAEERPDFQILFYPVISMSAELTHAGSRRNLLGDDADDSLVREYSNELNAGPGTPRAILLLSDDDTVVTPLNSTAYYEALRRAGVPAALHIYPSGGHGWGFKENFAYRRLMLDELSAWLGSF